MIYTKRNLLFGTGVFDYRVYNKDKSKDILVRKSTDSPKEMLEVFKKSPEELYDLMNNVTYELNAI